MQREEHIGKGDIHARSRRSGMRSSCLSTGHELGEYLNDRRMERWERVQCQQMDDG